MTSKAIIRKRTGIFLDSIQRNSAFGALNQGEFFTGAQNVVTQDTFSSVLGDSSPDVIARQNNSHQSLTGAAPAIIPLQIATARRVVGADGSETLERISFTMLISPETWNHGKTNSTQSTYTRNGWVPQMWGPNQDTISSNGRTAAFMTPAVGMDYLNDQLSFGYLNFLALISAYRNNGYVFQDTLAVDALTRVIKTVHGVQILYDGQILTGHFNSFTIDELEETPFVQNYNFEFIVSNLDGGDKDIRGHYRPLPTSEINLEQGTANDPGLIQFASDPYLKGIKPLVPPKAVEDKTTMRIWVQKTGLPWGDAFKYTNGSVQGNLELRRKLMQGLWDPTTKSFKSETVTLSSSSVIIA